MDLDLSVQGKNSAWRSLGNAQQNKIRSKNASGIKEYVYVVAIGVI
jgi:hypothetical protein